MGRLYIVFRRHHLGSIYRLCFTVSRPPQDETPTFSLYAMDRVHACACFWRLRDARFVLSNIKGLLECDLFINVLVHKWIKSI